MTTFDKREEAFERQLVHDEGVRFEALARRNKRLGLWAAERLGRTGTKTKSYAKVLAAIELQHHSDAEVASRVQRDLEAVGVSGLGGRDTASDGRTARQSHRRDQGRAIGFVTCQKLDRAGPRRRSMHRRCTRLSAVARKSDPEAQCAFCMPVPSTAP